MKFLKPYFKQIAANKQTTGLGHVTISDIKRLNLIIPDCDVQKQIVSVLKPIDDKINCNDAVNDNLAYVMGLLKLQRYRPAKTCSHKHKYQQCIIKRMLNSSRPKSREQSMAA